MQRLELVNSLQTAKIREFQLFFYVDKGQIDGSVDATVRVVGATKPTMMFGM